MDTFYKITARGSKTSTTGWDGDSGAIALDSGSRFVDVYLAQDTYLLPTATASAPATDGAVYTGSATHRIATTGCLYLHYKGVVAGAVRVTEFHV